MDTGDTEVGAGKVSLDVQIEGVDEGIGVNSTYMLDVLGVIKAEHITIQFETNLSPVLLTPECDDDNEESAFRHIIMPLKI